MIRKQLSLLVMVALPTLAGCENFYRGMYTGLQKREVSQDSTIQGMPTEPAVSYDQYKKEREGLLKKDATN